MADGLSGTSRDLWNFVCRMISAPPRSSKLSLRSAQGFEDAQVLVQTSKPINVV